MVILNYSQVMKIRKYTLSFIIIVCVLALGALGAAASGAGGFADGSRFPETYNMPSQPDYAGGPALAPYSQNVPGISQIKPKPTPTPAPKPAASPASTLTPAPVPVWPPAPGSAAADAYDGYYSAYNYGSYDFYLNYILPALTPSPTPMPSPTQTPAVTPVPEAPINPYYDADYQAFILSLSGHNDALYTVPLTFGDEWINARLIFRIEAEAAAAAAAAAEAANEDTAPDAQPAPDGDERSAGTAEKEAAGATPATDAAVGGKPAGGAVPGGTTAGGTVAGSATANGIVASGTGAGGTTVGGATAGSAVAGGAATGNAQPNNAAVNAAAANDATPATDIAMNAVPAADAAADLAGDGPEAGAPPEAGRLILINITNPDEISVEIVYTNAYSICGVRDDDADADEPIILYLTRRNLETNAYEEVADIGGEARWTVGPNGVFTRSVLLEEGDNRFAIAACKASVIEAAQTEGRMISDGEIQVEMFTIVYRAQNVAEKISEVFKDLTIEKIIKELENN